MGADEDYFRWLVQRVEPEGLKNPIHTHGLLLERMVRHPFTVIVPNDRNRVIDVVMNGESNSTTSRYWRNRTEADVSVLDLIQHLTDQIVFETWSTSLDFGFKKWFWILVDNLGLEKYTDEVLLNDPNQSDKVDHILERFVRREYDEDGTGGLFPLKNPEEDQREVELWYQLSSYLLENGILS